MNKIHKLEKIIHKLSFEYFKTYKIETIVDIKSTGNYNCIELEITDCGWGRIPDVNPKLSFMLDENGSNRVLISYTDLDMWGFPYQGNIGDYELSELKKTFPAIISRMKSIYTTST